MTPEQRALLEALDRFAIGAGDIAEIEHALARCWRSIAGGREGGMIANKLIGRMEDIEWRAPLLSFRIERHGGTALGSTRAEMQRWTIDTRTWSASATRRGYRQLAPLATRLNVEPLAAEMARLILERKNDARLKWTGERKVSIKIGKVIPADGFKQTITGRRKRFRAALIEKIAGSGWRETWTNTYERE